MQTDEKLRNLIETEEKVRNFHGQILTVGDMAKLLERDRKTVNTLCKSGKIASKEKQYGDSVTYEATVGAVLVYLQGQKCLLEGEHKKKQIKDHTPFVESWVEAMKHGQIPGVKGSYSPQTINNYERRIQKYLQSYSAITYQNIKEHLRGFKDKTSNKVQEYRALNSFSKHLFEENALDEKNFEKITGKDIRPQGNPTPKRHRVAYQDYRTLILKGCETIEDKAIIHILYHTGMRASEFCSIQAGHLNLEKQELFIPKSKCHKQRLLGLNTVACAVFAKYLKTYPKREGELLFLNDLNEPMDRSGLYARVRRMARHAGLGSSKIAPHAFRRSFGTFNLQKGRSVKSVQLALGHSKPSVTLEIYDTTTQQEVANMMKSW